MDEYPENPDKVALLEQFNLALTIIFMLEMLLKVCGLGLKTYCKDVFNIFDAMIVGVSAIELIAASSGGSADSSAISVLRTFRLFRVLKLARSWSSLRNLLATVSVTSRHVCSYSRSQRVWET